MKKEDPEKTHLRDYWRIVWQGKWTVLSIVMIVATLVAVATFMQTPIYRASAYVEVQPRSKSISPNADFSQIGVSSWNWSAEDRYINTQLEIIRSTRVAQATLENEGLLNSPQFAELDDPAALLASRVTLRVLPDTYIVEFNLDDPSPEMAQLLVNSLAETYVQMNVDMAKENTRRVLDDLDEQIGPITEDIAEKEQERLDLSRAENYYAPQAQGSSVGSRISQLEKELTNVRIGLGQRASVLNAIREIEKNGGNYESVPVVANDTIVIGLKEEAYNLEQQLDELSAAYRASHPKIVAARSALADVPRKIAAEAERIITKTRTEYAVDQRRESDLLDQLRRTRDEGLGLSQTGNKIERLDLEIRELRRISDLVTTRIKEIDLNQNTLVNNIRVVESASTPTYPVRPRKILNLAAGLLLGLFLGVGTAFFVDYLDNTIRSSEDIERFLDLPLLAMVPKSDNPESAGVKEANQTLRTSVLFASKGRSLNVIHVTSAGPGEGKSRTAVNLAKTLAQAGDQVLLIDADLRRPTVHKHFGFSRENGLTNYMLSAEGGDTWRHNVKRCPESESLSVLTTGPLPPKPVELFGAERFSDLVSQLKRSYQWVVIDSPPVVSLADSLVLGSLAEMTIFVIKHKHNDRELVRRSAEALRKVETNLVGAVLNAVDLRRADRSDYYYTSYEYVEETEKGRKKTGSK